MSSSTCKAPSCMPGSHGAATAARRIPPQTKTDIIRCKQCRRLAESQCASPRSAVCADGSATVNDALARRCTVRITRLRIPFLTDCKCIIITYVYATNVGYFARCGMASRLIRCYKTLSAALARTHTLARGVTLSDRLTVRRRPLNS